MTKPTPKIPNGRCAVCRHQERPRVELLLAGSASLRSVAAKFGLQFHAVRRHWLHHVDGDRKAALIAGPMKASELAERAADESLSLLDHLKLVRNRLYSTLDAATEAGDRNTVALVAGRLHENFNTWARLTGEIQKTGATVTNQINLIGAPDFIRLQAELIKALAPFPEARLAVISALRRLDGPHADDPPAGTLIEGQFAQVAGRA